MNFLSIILILTYTTIIVSLVWARFRFFKISQATPSIIARLYDPAVLLQFIFTFSELLNFGKPLTGLAYFTAMLYITSLVLFWWSISTTKRMGFALTSKVDHLFNSGPYAWIRHPFYTSYICVWVGSSLLFNSWILWITLAYLVTFYYQVAQREEKIIIRGEYSSQYKEYRQQVGMFFPRMNQWKL